MPSELDRLADGERELLLMERVRSGALSEAELDAALPAFPLKIQIQTISTCNAACQMCPWPDTKDELPQGAMREETFLRLAEQIAGRGIERTSLFLMNEPLLDRRLARFAAILKAGEPRTKTVIFTNGVLLTGERAEELASSGMDEINISVLGFEPESYARSMGGLSFDRIMRNLREIASARDAGRLGTCRVRIVGLEIAGATHGMEEFRRQVDLPIFLKPVTNRAGSVEVARFLASPRELGEFRACQRPFVKAYVLYDGELVLCNCDWRRTTRLGNLHAASIETLWRSARWNEIRRSHLRRALPAGSLCAGCDYPYLP